MALTGKPTSASSAVRQRQRLIVMLLLAFIVSVAAASSVASSQHPVDTKSRGLFFTRSRRHSSNSSASVTRDNWKHHALNMDGGGKACSIYIWDFPSALLSRWCQHLQRDCVYEGRGGHKFVRIEPGSMLQLLYPCSRYSTDRCWLCGGNFRDHLTLWWSKHLYTPFDLHVEQVFRDGAGNGSSATSKEQQKQQKQQNLQPPAEFAFHRRYVVDLPNLWVPGANTKNVPRDADKMMQRLVSQRFPLVQENLNRIEIRSRSSDQENAPSSTSNASSIGAQYAVPAIDKQRLGTPRHTMVLITVRELFLNAVESLMDLEQLDQKRLEQRQQQQQR